MAKFAVLKLLGTDDELKNNDLFDELKDNDLFEELMDVIEDMPSLNNVYRLARMPDRRSASGTRSPSI